MAIESIDIGSRDVEGKDDNSSVGAGGAKGANLFQIADQIAAAVGVGDAALAEIGQFAEALDHCEGEEQEDGEAGEPGGDEGLRGCATGEHAQGVEARANENVYQRNEL